MLFSSIPFLYYFFPIVLILYFLVPKAGKNLVLLLASLFFYWWGEPRYVVLMAVTIAFSYVCGLLIDRFRGRGAAKAFWPCRWRGSWRCWPISNMRISS